MSENITNFMDGLNENESTRAIGDLIEQVMAIPDDTLNDTTADMMSGIISGALTNAVKQEAVRNIMANFEENSYTRSQAIALVDNMKNEFTELLNGLQPSKYKRMILDNLFNEFYSMFDKALETYHNYNFKLPVKLDEGARIPTYAHDTDVAADLYAADDMIIPAHSLSNMVRTGVHIRLPEGWCAFVVPRSSIGSKTGLRLSNSQGVIDNDYTGPIGVLYDNISDSPYTIKAGDRIAQMYVLPVYHFKGVEVDTLEETERGEGGFGSSGK
jgi:dUTP pyrophosphatase